MCPNLSPPDGLFFGGGIPEQNRVGMEAEGLIVVMHCYLHPILPDIVAEMKSNESFHD